MSGRGATALLLAGLLAAGCSQGDGGKLEPAAGQSAERGDAAGSVVVRDGPVSATLTAHWAAERSQTANIVYRNEGATPVSIVLPHLAMHHERLGDAPLWSAGDMTAVNRDDARTDNDEATILYELETSPATTQLLLKPGERRELQVGFTNYPGDVRIAHGDRVTLTVPLGAHDRTVSMVAG